jgi:hypothetical protein
MSMTKAEFVENVAKLVAGLQVPVSLMPRQALGAAYEPWSKLLDEVNGGFGWTSADACRETFGEIADVSLGSEAGLPMPSAEQDTRIELRELRRREREEASDATEPGRA